MGVFVKIPRKLGMDRFQNRAQGKRDYVEQLGTLAPSLMASWVSRSDVDDRALRISKLLSCVDFCYL